MSPSSAFWLQSRISLEEVVPSWDISLSRWLYHPIAMQLTKREIGHWVMAGFSAFLFLQGLDVFFELLEEVCNWRGHFLSVAEQCFLHVLGRNELKPKTLELRREIMKQDLHTIRRHSQPIALLDFLLQLSFQQVNSIFQFLWIWGSYQSFA